MDGATGILLNISGGSDLGLFEINDAAHIVQSAADPNANIIFGSVIDETLGDEVRVTVIATGFDGTVVPMPKFTPARNPQVNTIEPIEPSPPPFFGLSGQPDAPAAQASDDREDDRFHVMLDEMLKGK